MSEVYKAISNVAKELAEKGISKEKPRGGGVNYAFRGIDAVYNALAPALVRHGLLILTRCTERSVCERTSKSGGVLNYVTVKAEFDFVSVTDGSKHTVMTYGEAMDSGDKATNKAMSIAYKYAAFQAFCIPTEETAIDADAEIHNVAPRTAEQVLADYTNFLGTATNQSQIMDEYKKAWNALAGTESQKECERLTGIRIKELKEAA